MTDENEKITYIEESLNQSEVQNTDKTENFMPDETNLTSEIDTENNVQTNTVNLGNESSDYQFDNMSIEDILEATAPTNKIKKVAKLFFNVILDVAFILMIFILVANIGFNQTYEIANVQGKSMLTTFEESGDAVCYKRINKYTRGDVIVYQRTTGTKVIKRVIALAGDKIRIDFDEDSMSYKVFLNNEVLDEPYLDEDYSSMQKSAIRFRELYYNNINGSAQYFDEDFNLVVPEGYIFYMGDNRTNSSDCVEYGPQITDNILGKVFFTYPSTWTEKEVKMTEIRIILFYGNLFNNFKPNFKM